MKKINSPTTTVASIKLRRKENRFTYSMPINVRTKNVRCEGQTINISLNGIKFSAQRKPEAAVKIGDLIYVSIPELNVYLDSFLVNDEQKKIREKFIYQVIHIAVEGKLAIVACEYVGKSISDLLMLESYVEDQITEHLIDKSHEYDNVKYSFYECMRFNDINQLIFYFVESDKRCLFIESEKNRFIYGYLTHKKEKPDLAPFLSPFILNYLSKKSSNDFYLFFYWENSKLHYKYSSELESGKEFNQLIQQTVIHKGFVLKGYCRAISTSDIHNENLFDTSRLNSKNAIYQVVFHDVSKFMHQCSYELMGLDKASFKTSIKMHKSEVVQFEYSFFLYNSYCQRLENRHLFKTHLLVKTNTKVSCLADSVDFSYSGLSLFVDNSNNNFVIGNAVLIDFIDLNKQMKKIDLTNIPYTVKNVIPCQYSNQKQIGLLKNSKKCKKNINQFFDVIVEKNRMKLPLCTVDKLSYQDKQLIQSRQQETLRSIPIFLKCNDENEFSIKEVKIYNENCHIAQFFNVNGEYDFSCLTRDLLLKKFSSYMTAKNYQRKPFLAFFIRVYDEIKVITNEEIRNKAQLYKIATDTVSRKGICALIDFYDFKTFDSQGFEVLFNKNNRIETEQKQEAEEIVKDLSGYIELTDINSYFSLHFKTP